jgi:uncharacterized protein
VSEWSDQGENASEPDGVPRPSLAESEEAQWKPLTAKQRRVLGTLMEKSKTTPDAYPMTFAGLCTGCNQKTNRAPISNYSSEQIETIVDELRSLGAITIVQGSGRVTKVRHYAYNWLSINKVEAAIMTELLLRGEQTVGELRTRASRMEPIQDMQQLNALLSDLKGRSLVVELSPPGRGQVVSHNLYPEWELEQVRKSVVSGASEAGDLDAEAPNTFSQRDISAKGASVNNPLSMSAPATAMNPTTQITLLNSEIAALKAHVNRLEERLSRLEKDLGVA